MQRPLSLCRRALLGLALCAPLSILATGAETFEPTDSAEPMVVVGPSLRQNSFALTDDLRSALRGRDWKSAAKILEKTRPEDLTGSQKSDWAFLLAWCLVHGDRADEAFALLPLFDEVGDAPETYTALIRGEVHMGRDEWLDALAALEQVPETAVIHPRAAVQRAEVLRELGRTQEAFEVYETLVQRPDPADGNPEALLALARHYGIGSEKGYPPLRRVWANYPHTEHAVEATRLLQSYAGKPAYQATWQEVGVRAERLMNRGDYDGALAETERRIGQATGDSVDACRYLYVRGRSHYKKNRLTSAIAAFADAGTRCTEAGGGYGARSVFLKSTALFRRKDFQGSARSWLQLPDLYPDHSMADDGLTRGGIALQEAGDLAGAQALWRRALEAFPDGDTVPEATWRLAFSLYLDGEPEEAVAVAEALGALPLSSDAVHVQAGRYWAARWKLYPDVERPAVAVDDPAVLATALDEWEALVVALPQSFYAILAAARIQELDPERAAQLSQRPADHARGDLTRPWVVRLSFLEDPSVQDGVALARLGLIREARSEWDQMEEDTLQPDEMAWLMELRILSGDWLYTHDHMRAWIKTHPVGTLGSREAQVVRLAYPDRYWDLVQVAAAEDRYDPRLFHALVREESNFNREIVSFAGAIGLSQLMPETAKQTAGWLGISNYSRDKLYDPQTNLNIGARYLDAMHKQLGGSPYLSLAAYNAGARRVTQWEEAWGNVPTDEFVERIPFRETREYVKRVMGTWQTMRWQFDDTPGFADLSDYNHHALLD